MIRRLTLLVVLLAPPAVFASNPAATPPPPAPPVNGVVADPMGAIVPGAEVDLVDTSGTVAGSCHSGDDGAFQLVPLHSGNFTLVVSEPGFETTKTPVVVAAPASVVAGAAAAGRFSAILHVTLPIAALSTNVHVNADSSDDLTAPEDNQDSSMMSSQDLKSLPIFDNDYATAMSAFLDDSATATGGSGLIVDGVEANRSTVSASAVQEVRLTSSPPSTLVAANAERKRIPTRVATRPFRWVPAADRLLRSSLHRRSGLYLRTRQKRLPRPALRAFLIRDSRYSSQQPDPHSR